MLLMQQININNKKIKNHLKNSYTIYEVIFLNYEIYKNVRNASWQCLIDCCITSLPTNLADFCKHFYIRIIENSSLKIHQLKDNERGKIMIFQNQLILVVRDTDPMYIQRYTIAHEIGHILLRKDISEYEAERFAIDVLAPACVLWALDMHEPEDIAKLCNISITSAHIRSERMELLYKREQEFLGTRGHSCFLQSPLERKVYEQFKPFIDESKSKI